MAKNNYGALNESPLAPGSTKNSLSGNNPDLHGITRSSGSRFSWGSGSAGGSLSGS